MVVEFLNHTDENNYKNFIENIANSTVYHTIEWRDIIKNSYGFKPLYIVAKEKNNIIGVLPLFDVSSFIRRARLVSIPFSHYVEILAIDDDTIIEMLNFLKSYFEKNPNYRYFMLNNSKANIKDPSITQKLSYYSCNLSLKNRNLDDIWNSFEGNVRKGIRKAQKNNVKINKGNFLDDYKTFYHLIELTRKKQGVPFYPFKFFENLYKKLLPKEMCGLYLASFENRVIAGILILFYKKYAIYGYGGSVNDKELLRYRPNNLLFWEAIQDCHKKGYGILDFGSTPISHEGLLRYKKQWGTIIQEMSYSCMYRADKDVTIDRNSPKVILMNNILKRCPLWLLRLISPLMIKEVS